MPEILTEWAGEFTVEIKMIALLTEDSPYKGKVHTCIGTLYDCYEEYDPDDFGFLSFPFFDLRPDPRTIPTLLTTMRRTRTITTGRQPSSRTPKRNSLIFSLK